MNYSCTHSLNNNCNCNKFNYNNLGNNQVSKVWYTQYRGYIVKNWIDTETNLIKQMKVSYNQPSNFVNYLDYYFTYKLN